MTDLAARIRAFRNAEHAFGTCPAMLRSDGRLTSKEQAISDTFFSLREELTELGLALDSSETEWTSIEQALFRWAVWQQAARLTLNHQQAAWHKPPADDRRRADPFEHDGAVIMEMCGRAERELFKVVE